MLETVPEVHPDTGSSDRPQGGRELSRNELSYLKKILYQVRILSTEHTFCETGDPGGGTGPVAPLRQRGQRVGASATSARDSRVAEGALGRSSTRKHPGTT